MGLPAPCGTGVARVGGSSRRLPGRPPAPPRPSDGGAGPWPASGAAACSAGGQAAAAVELAAVEGGQDRLEDAALAVEVGGAPVERVDLWGVAPEVAVGRHTAVGRQLAQLAEGQRVDAELVQAER